MNEITRNKDISTAYIAMFDEVDEGTVMFKLTEDESMLSQAVSLVPLNGDGSNLPSGYSYY